MAHLNIRSIRSKIDEVSMMLCNSRYDVLTISESWLHSLLESSVFNIEGYNLLRQDRKFKDGDIAATKRGGGLLAYVAEGVTFNANQYMMLNRSEDSLEMQIFNVKKGNDKESIIVNLYRPPSGNFNAFMNHIQQVLDTSNTERYHNIYIIGDVNLDHLPPINNEQTRSFE